MREYPLLIIAFIVVFCNEITNGHPFQTRSRNHPLFKDSCSYTCDNLASLLALSRTLDEKEEPVKEVVTTPALFNADELIMKLVNALVYATTNTAQNHCHCHCPNSAKSSASDDSRYNGVIHSSNSDKSHSNNGLLNADVLNSNKRNNILDLDLSNQHLIGVGLGDRNQDKNTYESNTAYSTDPVTSTSRASSSSSSKKQNNVAAAKHGEQNNTSEVHDPVLNPNKDNNVGELSSARQNVIGVGQGGSNIGSVNNIIN